MASASQAGASQPPADCRACPRLADFRDQNRAKLPGYHNGPVPSFTGDAPPWLLITGLAPGLHGANQTGRPFTGDYAGDLLYETLLKLGLAVGVYGRVANDGLTLQGIRITNAVRCVPPQNKPEIAEINACNGFLRAEITSLPSLKAIVALGQIAHRAVIKAQDERQAAYPFAHGACHDLGRLILIDSYHCSRYNTNTGRLTPAMFEDVFRQALTLRP